jgi:putative transposase
VIVHRADIQERDGAYLVVEDVDTAFPKLEKIWADQAYTGELAEVLQQQYGLTLEIVKKLTEQAGFVVLSRRWVVERTFAWLNRYRRLSKDYEHRPEYSETWVYIASITRMLRKLHPCEDEEPPYKRKKTNTSKETIMALYA